MGKWDRMTHEEVSYIVGFHLSGLNNTEIAAIIGRSQSAVDVRLRNLGFGYYLNDHRGELNPNWKGGTAPATITRLSKRLLDAAGVDQYTCQGCGLHSEQRLNIHHKDEDRTHNELSNFAVWCPACHARYHHPHRERDPRGRYI